MENIPSAVLGAKSPVLLGLIRDIFGAHKKLNVGPWEKQKEPIKQR